MNSPYTKSILKSFLGFTLLGLCLYIFLTLISYNSSDSGFSSFSSSNDIENLGGPFGAWISDVLFVLFGLGAYILLALLVIISIEIIFFTAQYSSKAKSFFRFFGSLITILCVCSLFEFYLDGGSYPELSAGGYIGNSVFIFLSGIFGQIGSLIFIVLFLIPAFALAFNFAWSNLIDKVGSFVIKTLVLFKRFILSLFKTVKNKFQEYQEKQKIKYEINAKKERS